MKVKYKIIERGEPGVVGGGDRKYYVTILRRDAIEFRDFIEHLSDRSTVSTSDIYAVLESLFKIIPWYLSEGRTVRFGHLGDFYLTTGSDGVDNIDDADARLIRKPRVIYRPSKAMLKFVNNLEFEKVRNPILEPLAPPGDEEPLDNAA